MLLPFPRSTLNNVGYDCIVRLVVPAASTPFPPPTAEVVFDAVETQFGEMRSYQAFTRKRTPHDSCAYHRNSVHVKEREREKERERRDGGEREGMRETGGRRRREREERE